MTVTKAPYAGKAKAQHIRAKAPTPSALTGIGLNTHGKVEHMYVTQTERRLVETRKALRRSQRELADARACQIEMPHRITTAEHHVGICLNRVQHAQEAVEREHAQQAERRAEFHAIMFAVEVM